MGHDRGCQTCGEVGVHFHCGNEACPRPLEVSHQLAQEAVLPVLKPGTEARANDLQIGGEHYRSEYQHWDLMVDCRGMYLEGCATKYLSRWRRKGGLEDLRKAIHFAEKLQENLIVKSAAEAREIRDHVERFCIINIVDGAEEIILSLILGAESPRDIEKALRRLDIILQRALAEYEAGKAIVSPPGYGNSGRDVAVEQEHPFGYKSEVDDV